MVEAEDPARVPAHLRPARRPRQPRDRSITESCAESSDTWESGRARSCCWPVWSGSSTAATTRPASACSTATSTSRRRVGRVQVLRDAVGTAAHPATTGLAHTRWATHGGVTESNAHPIEACEGSGVTVVHNGIIENYVRICAAAGRAGHVFHTDTDTEVIAHLVEEHLRRATWWRPCEGPTTELHGHFAFAVAHRDHPHEIVGGPPPVPAGGRRGRGRDVHGLGHPGLPARDTPRAVRAGRRDRGRPAAGGDLPDRRRRRARARGGGGRLGRRRGREAGLRDVHAEGDPRAAGRDRRDDRRAAVPRASCSWTASTCRERPDPRAVPGRHPGLRHRVPRRPDRPLPAGGVGAGARRSRTSPASGATGGR